MRRIVLANQKGGVSKTTTAMNLASGLAKAGRTVLLVDMDPQANATFATIGFRDIEASMYHFLMNDVPPKDLLVQDAQKEFWLIPSDIDLAAAELELPSRIGSQLILQNQLAALTEDTSVPTFDYIIVDSPPSLGYLTINALAAVEEVIIPISSSVFALKGLGMLERTISDIQTKLKNRDLHIYGVLCTMFEQTNIARDVLAQVQERYGDKVFKTVIPKNVKIEEAHSRAINIFDYAKQSTGAMAYQALVEEVLDDE